MRFLGTLLTGLAATASIAQAARVVYDWEVTYTTANPDGLFERQVVGVNGAWPPPAIHVSLNDTLVINVKNSLDIPTALHSHGMFQNNTVWMDGPVGVTQCSIPAGHSLTYEFNITQTGSFWIHSHYMGQYADGLRAPLILHNPEEPYKYDEDLVVPVSDWYHDNSANNLAIFMNVNNPTGAEPVPESGLIMDTINPNITFVPGKTYRLRLINMSAFSTFFISIDGHDLDIIEVDGIYTERKTVDSIYLTAAQRISVLVTAKNSTELNYLFHADMDIDMFDILPEDLVTNITANIMYDASHSNFAESQDLGMGSEFDDIDLPPLYPASAVEPDQQVNLTFNFDVTTDGINRGMFNELPYLTPKVPTLNTVLSMGELATDLTVYGPQSQAIILDHLNMVEIVLNNLDAGNHPFHLHGHVFQVVARGDGVFMGDRSTVEWNNENPTTRDTVLVPAESFTIIRFRADNPGVWIFHCHIEWHLETGLAVTFIEAPTVMQERMTLPEAFHEVCTAGGNPSTGNAAGKEGLDLKGAPGGITLIPDAFTAKGKGAMAACIISALIGMGAIVLYASIDPEKKAKDMIAAQK
ncbi:multicopper oxidase [Phycomyces blakesleeanus]|uniref:Multicopper oxidase n=2 Tax=Phycomyces blakesleeanus TaxID=4837 RepID=A0A162XYG3_PHYB8|nr:multicopper oxidase [Phycomyces blakesleeanus NRRL 1555(-)]OAD77295.1 multicopper oxidase [Phycomyces blakesleeanus NRRL 1555(-)]|eukprot:XP_018295335.1 multicopper oxidase [Phycomyces blakesleeanus NRRL 1555(-)]